MTSARNLQVTLGERTARSDRPARPRRLPTLVALAAGTALVAGACASSHSTQSEQPTAHSTGATSASAAAQRDIAGTFDVGGGRKMYLQCTGRGSPTVVLISGGGIAADQWDSPLGQDPHVYPT